MHGITAYIVCVLGLAAIFLLRKEINELKNYKTKELSVMKRLHRVLNSLIVLPVVAVVIICVVLILFFKHDLMSRFTHGIFVLSQWMLLTGISFTLIFKIKIYKRVSAAALLSAAVLLLLIAYFTPIYRFLHLFNNVSNIIPFSVGLFTIVYVFFILLSLKIELRLPTGGSDKNQ